MSVKTLTFGCRLNSFESEVMKKAASEAGLADSLIVNTCAVTGEAVRQARQAIRRARRENPGTKIIVTGCAAQTEAEVFGAMAEVDLVIGNDDKLKVASYQSLDFGVADFEKVRVNDIMEVTEHTPHMVDGFEGRARAFVQVQNGCDHRCTFCIIPYGRGPSRSVPMGAVVKQIKHLVDRGYGEVVLTGVDITSYGPDLPGNPSLGQLVQEIMTHVPDLARLRISSIDSIEIDEALLDVVTSEKRVMPHLHLSLQSGDNMILKRMKRRHLREHTIEFCQAMKKARPDMVFGADIIAGFPTETEAMFDNSLDIVGACDLTYLHVFPYSVRPGTPAAKMPQVNGAIIKERAARLRARGEVAFATHLAAQVGQMHRVLFERDGIGRTELFTPVATDFGHSGQILDVRISGHDGKVLQGVLSNPMQIEGAA